MKVEDFLNPSTKLSGFHICIDKGTFDAISLNPDNAIEKRKQYVESLSRVLKVKGFFLITSCNWTKEELLDESGEGFELFEELPTPKFSFGSQSGNCVAALVFQKTWDFTGQIQLVFFKKLCIKVDLTHKMQVQVNV